MRFDLYRQEVRAVEPSPHVYAAVRAALDASETEMAPLERRASARRYRALAAACLALLIVAASSSWIPVSIVPKEDSAAYASPLRLASPFIPLDENCAILVDADRGVASAALRVSLGCLGSEGTYDVGVRGAGLSFLPEGAHLGDPTSNVLRFSTGDKALAYLVVEVPLPTDEGETLDEPLRELILAEALGSLEGGEITLAAEGHASAVYRIQGVEAPSSSSSLNSRSRIDLALVNFPSSETAAHSSV